MPRVLHITEAADGGVMQHLQYLLPELKKQGMECDLLLYGNRISDSWLDWIEEAANENDEDRIFVYPDSFPRLSFPDKILEYIHWRHPDILHCHAFWAGLTTRLTLSKALPVFYTPHCFKCGPGTELKRRLCAYPTEQILRKKTAHYIFIGRSEVEFGEKSLGLSQEQFTLALNGLPEKLPFLSKEEARQELHMTDGFRHVAAIGRLAPQKNIRWMLGTLRTEWHGEPLMVHLIGEGPNLSAIQKFSQEQEGQPVQLQIHEEISHAFRLLPAFDALLLPSLYEGLSYTLLEAVAAGTPILASDIPGNHISEEFDMNIRYFPLGQKRAFTDALAALLSSPYSRSPETVPSLQRQATIIANAYKNFLQTEKSSPT